MWPSLFDSLAALPTGWLYLSMGLLAAIENVFPPIPADVLVAFGGFLAARSGQSPWPAFAAVWVGNVAGAVVMYAVGRRFGSDWTERKFRLASSNADARLLAWHRRYGLAGFFISRFVPGVRSVVPPVAGALRIPIGGLLGAIAPASALWYGVITLLAFQAGSNWQALVARVGSLTKWMGIAAAVLLAIGAAYYFVRRRK